MKVKDEKLQELQNLVFDHYLDYVASQRVDEFLDTLPPDDAGPSFAPSDEFMNEMQQMMDQFKHDEEKKRKRKNRRLRFVRAAAGLAVIISVAGVASVSVEAFRVPMFQFFVKNEDKYNQVDLKDPGSSEYEKEQADKMQEEFPGLALPKTIPEGYEYLETTGDDKSQYATKYEKNGEMLLIIQSMANNASNFADAEKAKSVMENVGGNNCYFTTKDGDVNVMWEKYGQTYNVLGEITKDEAKILIENMVYKEK